MEKEVAWTTDDGRTYITEIAPTIEPNYPKEAEEHTAVAGWKEKSNE